MWVLPRSFVLNAASCDWLSIGSAMSGSGTESLWVISVPVAPGIDLSLFSLNGHHLLLTNWETFNIGKHNGSGCN